MDEATKNAKFARYEALKIQEKEIKAEIEELKEELTPLVSEDEKVNCVHGVIELKHRDTYVYTEPTQALAKELKQRQGEEVAKGLAVCKPTYYIEYRQKDREVVE